MKNWYAVFAKPKQDAYAETQLLRQGFETFRPLIRTRRRMRLRYQAVIESMFPRYMFVYLDDQLDDWSPIRSTYGVSGLVRMGDHVPAVPAELIAELRRRADEHNVIEINADDEFKANQPVLITEGPLAGYQALFSARNSQERVIVLLNLIQVTLPAHAITRV
jgi:transcriptional antiterminator RfaH